MDQSPWARRVPPRPPSAPGGSPKAPNESSSSAPISGPPGRPSSGMLDVANRPIPSKVDSQKKSSRLDTKSFKRLASGAMGVILIGGVGFFIFSDRSKSTEENRTTQSSATLVDTSTSVLPSNLSTVPPIDSEGGKADWGTLARSVVFIEALSPCDWRGSGTLVLDGSYVLTNEHVASDGHCKLKVGFTENLSSEPSGFLSAIVVARDADIDLAVLRLVDYAGNPVIPSGRSPVSIDYDQPLLGSKLTTLGYPALGAYEAGMTITYTSGDFSGIDNTFGEFYKTTAQMRGGISGGAAFSERGLFIGVPTAGLIDEDGKEVGINLIRPAKYAKPLLEQAQSNPLGASDISSSGSSSNEGDLEQSQADPRFGTCREAKARGYGPYYSDFDPEYDWYRDADSDGVVCE